MYKIFKEMIGGEKIKSRVRDWSKKSDCIAVTIVICGIVIDVFINIIKDCFIPVSESYMDYVYSAIITISILSFSIIALISGMVEKTYYGYKLGEIIQFKESSVNFKRYIFVSFSSIAFATIILFVDFKLCSANSLTALLFAVIFLEGKMAYNVYKIMVDESVCYQLVSLHYNRFSKNDINYNLYKKEIERLFMTLKQCIKENDSEGKELTIELLAQFADNVGEALENSNEIYQCFYCKMEECVYDIANNFGYNEMIRDVIKIFRNLSKLRYEMIDLYLIPLQKMRFWDDQMLLKNNYFNQINEIDFMEEYRNDLMDNVEIEKIFYCYFENIIKNRACTKIVKDTIIEDYLSKLTKFYWKGENKNELSIDSIGIINIWHNYILKNENIKEREYIFSVLIKNILYNNFLRGKNYYDVLSLILQSFYSYVFCERETLTIEYRKELQKTIMQPITNATIQNYKLSELIKENIEGILVSVGDRIGKKSVFERRFEYYSHIVKVKPVVWTQEFNIKFLFMIYIIYYGEIGFYSLYKKFMKWDKIEDRYRLEILKCFTREFDYESRRLKYEFQQECLEFSTALEHTYKISEVEQETLFEYFRAEQEKIKISSIEDIEEMEIDNKEIYQRISELMEKEQVFGWTPEFVSESYIKYMTPVHITRKEHRTIKTVARTLELATIEAVKRFIQKNTNELELPLDMEGVEQLLQFVHEHQFEARNFSYTDNWGLAKYREEQKLKSWLQSNKKLKLYVLPKFP